MVKLSSYRASLNDANVLPEASCDSWCATHDKPWSHKCKAFEWCIGCTACTAHGIQLYGNSGQQIDHVLMLEKFKILLCRIPKNGITTLNNVATIIDPESQIVTETLTEHTFNVVRQRLHSPDWHSVVVYRDPAERFLSTYRSKCLGADSDGASHCYRTFNLSEAEVSIDAVAARLAAFGHMDSHWVPQSMFCGGTVGRDWKSYKHRIMHSNLTSELMDVLEQALPASHGHVKQRVRLWLETNATGTTHSTHASDSMSSLLSRPAAMKHIFEFYRADYELLHSQQLYELRATPRSLHVPKWHADLHAAHRRRKR